MDFTDLRYFTMKNNNNNAGINVIIFYRYQKN